MGVDTQVVDENGNIIKSLPDPLGFLSSILPSIQNNNSFCIRFIDPYGDVIFNHLQIPELISELQEVIEHMNDEKVKNHAKEVVALARECLLTVHLYLKFSGD